MKMANGDGRAPSKASSKKQARRIVLIMAIAVLAVALFFIGAVVMKYVKGANELKRAKDLYDPASTPSNDIWVTPDEVKDGSGVTQDFQELYKVNEDVIGWINIPDTKMDSPVVLGDDNVYYLDKTIEHRNNPFGVPFADYRSVIIDDFQSTNVTIYGHAAKDGSYFAPVKEYKDVEFYKKHPTLVFNTLYGKGEYKVIGMFMEDVRASNPKRFAYHLAIDMNEEELMDYVDNVTKRSYFTTDVDVQAGDHLVTLSTCDTEIDSSTSTPYRVVLVARKIRDGESRTVNVEAAKENTSMIMPDGWVSKKGKDNPYK